MKVKKEDIQNYAEIIDDFLLDPDILGSLQGIINFYNNNFTIENLNEAIILLLGEILETGYISIDRVYNYLNHTYQEPEFKTAAEIVTFVKSAWTEMAKNDPLWYYIIFFKVKMPISKYKILLAKASQSNWVKISNETEKLEHTINPGLAFIYKKEATQGKPIIETWKNGNYISTRTFEK